MKVENRKTYFIENIYHMLTQNEKIGKTVSDGKLTSKISINYNNSRTDLIPYGKTKIQNKNFRQEGNAENTICKKNS